MSEQKHISQKSIPLWRTRCTVLALPVFFTCGVVLKFTVLWGLPLLLLVCAAYALVMLWYFPRRFLSIKFRFGEKDAEIQSGVFFQNIYMLDCGSIIFTRYTQTPLQHLLKICTVQLHPIGKAVNLPQLPVEEAKDILRAVEEKNNEV